MLRFNSCNRPFRPERGGEAVVWVACLDSAELVTVASACRCARSSAARSLPQKAMHPIGGLPCQRERLNLGRSWCALPGIHCLAVLKLPFLCRFTVLMFNGQAVGDAHRHSSHSFPLSRELCRAACPRTLGVGGIRGCQCREGRPAPRVRAIAGWAARQGRRE